LKFIIQFNYKFSFKMYTCECGHTIKKSSMKRHLQSIKHNSTFKCGICYENKKTHESCSQCHNKICSSCFFHIKNFRCPFCRHTMLTEKQEYVYQDYINHIQNAKELIFNHLSHGGNEQMKYDIIRYLEELNQIGIGFHDIIFNLFDFHRVLPWYRHL
jgi:hypothetical protein